MSNNKEGGGKNKNTRERENKRVIRSNEDRILYVPRCTWSESSSPEEHVIPFLPILSAFFFRLSLERRFLSCLLVFFSLVPWHPSSPPFLLSSSIFPPLLFQYREKDLIMDFFLSLPSPPQTHKNESQVFHPLLLFSLSSCRRQRHPKHQLPLIPSSLLWSPLWSCFPNGNEHREEQDTFRDVKKYLPCPDCRTGGAEIPMFSSGMHLMVISFNSYRQPLWNNWFRSVQRAPLRGWVSFVLTVYMKVLESEICDFSLRWDEEAVHTQAEWMYFHSVCWIHLSHFWQHTSLGGRHTTDKRTYSRDHDSKKRTTQAEVINQWWMQRQGWKQWQ